MRTARLAAAAAALLLGGAVLSMAGPAFADGAASSLAPCTTNTSAPLYTAKCAPTVSGTIGGTITVTLPGVGSVTFNTTKDGVIDTSTQPSVSLLGQNFSAGTPKISVDGTRITVQFVNIAEPEQHYSISVKIAPPTSGTVPTIKAVAGPTDKGKGKGKHHGHDDRQGKPDDQKGKPDDDADDGGHAQGQPPGPGVKPLAVVQGQGGGNWSGGAAPQGPWPGHTGGDGGHGGGR
ncbi:MAG TPA: hypothetical protein VMU14_05640 [Acidimicrobiales bacterium]|nr:hypothetical protein [Acidimicrobiales bacterium]